MVEHNQPYYFYNPEGKKIFLGRYPSMKAAKKAMSHKFAADFTSLCTNPFRKNTETKDR